MTLSRRHVVKTITGGTLACAVPIPAWAHRQKQALTTVTWNAKTNLLQVTHALHAHDAEQVLARLGLIDSPDLTNLRARASLALYTQKHFKLRDLDGKTIPLTILGAETDTTYAHVYLEAKPPKAPRGLMITDTLLQDIFPDQINQVNVTLTGALKSVVFITGAGSKKILA